MASWQKKNHRTLSVARSWSKGNEASEPDSVLFNFNGHTWEAFEVLGVPRGASLKDVENAYQQATADCDRTDEAILQVALEAIRKHLGSQNSAPS